jgi:hypothetical protein
MSSNIQANNNKDYRDCVKEFYRLLFSENKVTLDKFSAIYTNASPNDEAWFLKSKGKFIGPESDFVKFEKNIRRHTDTLESQILLALKIYSKQLTQGLEYGQLCKLIDLSSVYNEGFEFSMILELKFSDKVSVYFEMNQDTPKQIQYIWLTSGESLDDLAQRSKFIERFLCPGILNDPLGFTDIREKPDNKSKIVGRLIKNNVFYYTPNGFTDWWSVYKVDGGKQLGYIHRSRILKFSEFPSKLKKIVKKQRSGC